MVFRGKKAMKKVGNKGEDLIHCSNLVSDCGIILNSDL